MKFLKASLLIVGLLALGLGALLKDEKKPSSDESIHLPSSSQMANPSPAARAISPGNSMAEDDEETLSNSFAMLATRTLKNLPTNADLRKLTAEEVHHTPALLMQAAGELGDVAEALETRLKQAENNPTEKAEAIQDGITFYQECMNGPERPSSVRALCYSHYRELRELSGKPETQAEAQNVPANVRSLVDFLADR
ncbi:MAG: hypothetical protein ACJ763_04640 [Bdellovibrionia bacterium]